MIPKIRVKIEYARTVAASMAAESPADVLAAMNRKAAMEFARNVGMKSQYKAKRKSQGPRIMTARDGGSREEEDE